MLIFVFAVCYLLISAFVAKLFLREDVLLENVNTSPKPKNIESTTSSVDGDCNLGVGQEFYAMDVTNRGILLHCM